MHCNFLNKKILTQSGTKTEGRKEIILRKLYYHEIWSIEIYV